MVLPGSVFTLYALQDVEGFLSGFFLLALSVAYFWSILTVFCVSNQLFGIEEDRLNKSDRPIVSGLISIEQARLHLWFSIYVSFSIAWILNILGFYLIALVLVFLYNFKNLDRHWLTKNALTALGIFVVLVTGEAIVRPLNELTWLWSIFLSGIWLFMSPIQDLRDISGDRKVNRKTLPIVLGKKHSCYFLSVGFCILLVIYGFGLSTSPGYLLWVALIENLIFAGLSLTISIRLLLFQDSRSYDQTYTLFQLLYAFAILSSYSFLAR
ncbi:MAG: UbiA family prenyltransferase [Spirulina sp. SIO3F2]|nr:UbiA family prenyltransferase [Spirulina sp. SIO3F2]